MVNDPYQTDNHIVLSPVHRLLEKSFSLNREKVAIMFKESELTFGQLNETANQFANYLIQKGLVKGQVVALVMDRSLDLAISVLGVLKAGGVFLPIDSQIPKERIEYMLNDSASSFVVYHDHYHVKYTCDAKEIIFEDFLSQKNELSWTDPYVHIVVDDLAYIIYTSGSTGKPKGVMIGHGNLCNALNSYVNVLGISSTDKILGLTTFSFDPSLLELFLPMLVGAGLYLLDKKERNDARVILSILESEKISVIQATPSFYMMLMDAGWNHSLPLKVLIGGEHLEKDFANKLLGLCDSLWNLYGPTETTIWSTIKEIRKEDDVISVGKPIDNVQLYILDESLNPVEQGVPAEIFISGSGVGKGYVNKQELTAEKFLPDPFSVNPAVKMYRTGDIGAVLPNGDIVCMGRVDSQVKLRGYRVELGEIEHLLNSFEDIKVSVATVLTSGQRLAAYIVMVDKFHANDIDSNTELQLNDMAFVDRIKVWKAKLSQTLPNYMIPSDFIILKNMPLNLNGKIDRQSLQSMSRGEVKNIDTADLTEEEIKLTRIWCDTFDISFIDKEADFFDLGGHSLIAIKIITRIEKEFNIKLQISVLLEYPTIVQLAEFVKSHAITSKWKSLVPIKSTGKKPPLYVVHGGGLGVYMFFNLSKMLNKDQPLYGFQALGIDGIYKPLSTVEEMASFYISEMLEHNPKGPYLIAGHSDGGVIAFEIAKQLAKMERQVEYVALFDCNLEEILDNYQKKAGNFFTDMYPVFRFNMKLLYKYPERTIRFFFKRWKLRYVTLLSRMGFEKKVQLNGFEYHIQNAVQMYEKALKNYKFEPYEGKIDLFRSEIRLEYQKDLEFLGWQPFVSGGIRVHEVPGNHDEMFLPPHSSAFAQKLEMALQN